MHLIFGDAMDFRLCSGEPSEDGCSPCDNLFIEGTALEQVQNGRQGPEILTPVAVYFHLHAADALERSCFDRENQAGKLQLAEFVGQDMAIQSGMEQGAEQHIAADPGKAIGKGNAPAWERCRHMFEF